LHARAAQKNEEKWLGGDKHDRSEYIKA